MPDASDERRPDRAPGVRVHPARDRELRRGTRRAHRQDAGLLRREERQQTLVRHPAHGVRRTSPRPTHSLDLGRWLVARFGGDDVLVASALPARANGRHTAARLVARPGRAAPSRVQRALPETWRLEEPLAPRRAPRRKLAGVQRALRAPDRVDLDPARPASVGRAACAWTMLKDLSNSPLASPGRPGPGVGASLGLDGIGGSGGPPAATPFRY